MATHHGRRYAVICSHPDKVEVTMRRFENYTEILVRITRNIVIALAMIVGLFTGSGALHQVAVFFE